MINLNPHRIDDHISRIGLQYDAVPEWHAARKKLQNPLEHGRLRPSNKATRVLDICSIVHNT